MLSVFEAKYDTVDISVSPVVALAGTADKTMPDPTRPISRPRVVSRRGRERRRAAVMMCPVVVRPPTKSSTCDKPGAVRATSPGHAL
jgi:hypothetical protein